MCIDHRIEVSSKSIEKEIVGSSSVERIFDMIWCGCVRMVPRSIRPRHKAPLLCWIWGQPGSKIGQISDGQRGAAMEVEVAFGAHGVFPLPMGMERKDRCE